MFTCSFIRSTLSHTNFSSNKASPSSTRKITLLLSVNVPSFTNTFQTYLISGNKYNTRIFASLSPRDIKGTLGASFKKNEVSVSRTDCDAAKSCRGALAVESSVWTSNSRQKFYPSLPLRSVKLICAIGLLLAPWGFDVSGTVTGLFCPLASIKLKIVKVKECMATSTIRGISSHPYYNITHGCNIISNLLIKCNQIQYVY